MSEHLAAPKAFISHASEDKHIFGEPLALRLRELGIDAWLDKWEMLPGDSLIPKIFSEGIQESDAVIILLSAISVAKPWVQKELNVAAVKHIEGELRLIPVRIDDCEVPAVLRDLLWLDWAECGDVEGVSNRIAETLFGQTSRYPLGAPPPHLTDPRFTIPGLNARDVKVLQVMFEASLDHGLRFLQGNVILKPAEEHGLSYQQVKESTTMLESLGYLKNEDQTLAKRHVTVTLDARQVLKLAESYEFDCEALLKHVVALVCNGQFQTLYALEKAIVDFPKGLVEATVMVLVRDGFWKASGAQGGDLHLHSVAPKAKRWLEENS